MRRLDYVTGDLLDSDQIVFSSPGAVVAADSIDLLHSRDTNG